MFWLWLTFGWRFVHSEALGIESGHWAAPKVMVRTLLKNVEPEFFCGSDLFCKHSVGFFDKADATVCTVRNAHPSEHTKVNTLFDFNSLKIWGSNTYLKLAIRFLFRRVWLMMVGHTSICSELLNEKSSARNNVAKCIARSIEPVTWYVWHFFVTPVESRESNSCHLPANQAQVKAKLGISAGHFSSSAMQSEFQILKFY